MTLSPLAVLGLERLLESGARSLASFRLRSFRLGLQAAPAAPAPAASLRSEQGPDHVQELGKKCLDRFGQTAFAQCRCESLVFRDERAGELSGVNVRYGQDAR